MDCVDASDVLLPIDLILTIWPRVTLAPSRSQHFPFGDLLGRLLSVLPRQQFALGM
jgi:hypothetical protein